MDAVRVRQYHEEMTTSLLEEVVERRTLHKAEDNSKFISHDTLLPCHSKTQNHDVSLAPKPLSEAAAPVIQKVEGLPATADHIANTPAEPKIVPGSRATEIRSTSSTTFASILVNLPKVSPGKNVRDTRIEPDSGGVGEGRRREHGERRDPPAYAERGVPTAGEVAAAAVCGREAECRRIALAMIEQVRISRV